MPRKAKSEVAQEEITNTEEIPATVTEEPEKKSASKILEPDGELVVDVFETNADFVVLAAIAGVQIKDIDISLEKDMMVIRGNRCDPHDHPDKKFFYQECYWGPFSRKIVLPENIDIDNADAQMDKGVLTIKIPKNEASGKKLGVSES